MSDKIKKFIDCYVPVNTCNLRCHYCYIAQNNLFNSKLPDFKYDAKHIGKALSKERLGGTCCINFCGSGETLLPQEIIPIVKSCLEQGHYVMIVTNGIFTKRFEEIAQFPKSLLERLFFKFSFHYLELKRTNQLQKFFSNIKMMEEKGCSYTVEITPNDELIPHIEDIKRISLENVGALPHVTVARNNRFLERPILTDLTREEYIKTWSSFDSELFNYKISVFNQKREEYCNAGAWTYLLDIGTGKLKQCHKGETVQNIFKDLNSKIKEKPIQKCKEAHCFNAHAFLCFGAIEEHNSPTYLAMRDRIKDNGEHWCKEPVRSFFSTKLKDSNKRKEKPLTKLLKTLKGR